MIEQQVKQVPYGVADFAKVIEQNLYYVDKTMFIPYADKLQLLFQAAKAHNYPLYLIIDEYDNFTNVVLNEHGGKVYHAITHADGFYRDVFKKFKGNFERIFMMGVSPVTLDDVTSGYNIGWNISIKPVQPWLLRLLSPP